MCVTHGAVQPPAASGAARRTVTRRNALRAATVAAAGATALIAAGNAPASAARNEPEGHARRVPKEQISIQLFTLRDQLAIDLDGTLAELRRIGYTRVEHAGFVGRTAAQFRAALDAAGIRSSSGHVGIPQPFDASAWERALEDAHTVGSRFVVHPFFGIDSVGQPLRVSAPYHALARDLNRAGTLARRAGLQFGYHNHHLEFFRLDGGTQLGFDILTRETDPDLVHFEVDLFWATRGAHDPVDLIEEHRGRIRQFHVKDMNVNGSFEDAGQGVIDFARIFRHARQAGTVEFIVERDDAGTFPRVPADALSTARVGYNYLDTLPF